MQRHFLFLQGLPGPFFRQLATELRNVGARVSRVNFNGGDWFDWRVGGGVSFKGTLDGWPAFLESYVSQNAITDIVLFGEFRPVHRAAFALNTRSIVGLYIFEEGFLRPYHTTLEHFKDGTMQPLGLPSQNVAEFAGHFRNRVIESCLYWLAVMLAHGFYPQYRSHRPDSAVKEFRAWLLRRWRRRRESYQSERALAALKGRSFFLFPLQLDGDAQIRDRSPFSSIEDALDQVLDNFSNYAPAHICLLVKRHPLDPSVTDWRNAIAKGAQQRGITGRVLFVERADLDPLLRDCAGVVTINSTVGPLALQQGKPVFVLADAVYRRPELVHQGRLDDFWTEPQRPNKETYAAFVAEMQASSQINGGFHSAEGLALLIRHSVVAINAVKAP